MSDEHKDAWSPVLLEHAGLMFDVVQTEAMKELHRVLDGLNVTPEQRADVVARLEAQAAIQRHRLLLRVADLGAVQ